MWKKIVGIGLAVWFVLGAIGNLQTAESIFENRGRVIHTVGFLLTSPWSPAVLFVLGIVALVLNQHRESRQADSGDDIYVELVRNRWVSPALARVSNRSRDYPAHIKTATLFGTLPEGRKQRIATAWMHKFEDCVTLPHSVPPDRTIQIAFAGHFPYHSFESLFVELELENGRQVVSPPVKPPEPPALNGITYDQETQMLKILEKSPTTPVMITWTKGDRSASRYANRLAQVLTKAGIDVGEAVFDGEYIVPGGVNIWWVENDSNNRQVACLRAAISATNVKCGDAPRPAIPNHTSNFEINIMVREHRG